MTDDLTTKESREIAAGSGENKPPDSVLDDGKLEKAIRGISKGFGYAGMTVIIVLILLTLRNSLGRFFFDAPVSGNAELTMLTVVTGIFLSVVYTMYVRGHVAVTLISDLLPSKISNVLYCITSVLSGIFLVYVGWVTINYSPTMMKSLSTILHVPKGYFIFIVGISFVFIALLLFRQMWQDIGKTYSKACAGILIIVTLLLSTLVIFVGPFDAFIGKSAPTTAGAFGLILFLVLMFMRIPVAIAMGLGGLIGLMSYVGWAATSNVVAAEPFSVLYNYTWSAIPTFVFMGYLAKNTYLAEEFYFGIRQWLGHLPGGLMHAVVLGNGAFGACSGDPMGAAVTFCSISLPETRKYGYDDATVLGCISGGCVLAAIIPPSMLFIIFGAATSNSIGRLFMAGIFPGILLIILYMLLIVVLAKQHPDRIPRVEKASREERLKATPRMLYLVIVFVVVIGGIYAGIFSPTEAGTFGATAVFIIGLVRRKITWATFKLSMLEAASTLGMIGLILAGAMILQRLVVVTGITKSITDLIIDASSSQALFWVIAAIMLIILGCFIDALPLIMLMAPLLTPVAVGIGIDPIHFGVFMTIVMLIGNLTPPVGMVVYVLAGVVPEVPMSQIFKRVMPFVAVMVVVLMIVAFVPPLSTVLPNMMLGA
jgi:tripartite ATP-independent transporter DctM subunit